MAEKILPLIEYRADELVRMIVIAGVVVPKSPSETETNTNYRTTPHKL